MNRSPYPTMRDRFDLRAYFVVGPDDTKGRPVADVVATALRGGATFIQLRAKHADTRDLTAMAEAIAAVIAQAGKADTVAFVIDDRVDAAWQCRELGIKVDGVHIGQDDMAPEQARALLGPDAVIGLSAETLPHIKAANALSDGTIDYIGAGPLHYTATKPDAAAVEADGTKHALGIAGAQLLCEASRYPVVVGGGVHADDVPALARTAAAGWFVVSAIAAADDPERATRELLQAWTAVRGDARHGVATSAASHPQSDVAAPLQCGAAMFDVKQPHGLPPVLTVAGSDSSGGAGIQADLKTMLANGVFGMSAITSLTAQNTTGVRAVQNADPAILADQIDAVFEDIPPMAVKIGMVSSAALIETIADRLTAHQAQNIVLDPVMVATSGAKLIDDDAVAALTTRLFPLATVITPNMPETEALLEQALQERSSANDDPAARLLSEGIRAEADMETAGRTLAEHFGCAVLVKGGHGVKDANDVLVEPDGAVTWFTSPRIDNPNTHGTGCTLSSAIASHLALGETLPQAVRSAKDYLTGALAEQLDLGHGAGPMDHAWRWR
ncbi:phosphomethylpyrimidine kinase [Bifidobacterium pullorum subsp. gallinarum]|uniref:Thiamine-phosphate synthase n=2 Tax=Bifidobacterium pullorum TaxID=78448 RepID=A0A087ARB0_9BIFI|nr:bifunctional hydroxymethylpyrimidine kinase/phosphomethylpyrimidine kinase [Bifidobacterium pullorum]KFI61310.1 phosphomethylpyrimidine kinase [Bifidobacterium pullorum subsp. gallinarum]